MGNILSTLKNEDDNEHVQQPETDLNKVDDNIQSDMVVKDADDLDFIAGEIILTTNTEHLSKAIGSNNKETERTTILLEKISEVVDEKSAIAKYSRIVENTSSDNTEAHDTDKARLEVSKYYLDIARILVAISLAIQPENEAEIHTDDSDDILTPNFSMARMSFCGSRINRFAKTSINGTEEHEEDNHNVAEMTTLGDRYGIPELYDLYFDTDYDQETGSFLGMTEETKTMFEQDLAKFYRVFSGESSVPESITRFGDIPLNNSNQEDEDKDVKEKSSPLFICKFDTNDEVDCDPLFNSVHGNELENEEDTSIKSHLLTEFAEHLQKMIKSVIVKRRRLVEIVNRMFVFRKLRCL